MRFHGSYSHILLPIAIHNELIWRVLTVLRAIGALPASRCVELVPHEGFEMSRKSPGTVIEIFRDNLGIERFFYFSPNPKMIHRLIRSVPWMMLNCSEKKIDEFEMKWNVMLEKNAQFSEWIFTFRRVFQAMPWDFAFHAAPIEFKMHKWIFLLSFERKESFLLRFFEVDWILVVHTLMQNLFYPKSIFCPRYLTINLKSSERSSLTLQEIE